MYVIFYLFIYFKITIIIEIASTSSVRKLGSPKIKNPYEDFTVTTARPELNNNRRQQSFDTSITSTVTTNYTNNSTLAEPAFECLVLYDYHESDPEALYVCKGDTIQVWSQNDTWYYASLSVNQAEYFGWVPSQYCQQL